MTTDQKLSLLRSYLRDHHLSAYLLTSSDPHQSEYVAGHWLGRVWLSGFTGSAGTVIVTPDQAGLWTDSRYFLQAADQLADSEVVLHKLLIPHTPEYIDWLVEHLPQGSRLGFDGRTVSRAQARRLAQALTPHGIEIDGSHDALAASWSDRPAMPSSEVYLLPTESTGESRTDKLARLREQLAKADLHDYLFVALDDIAWLLNLRAADVEFNPVAYAYFLLQPDAALLFIEQERLSASVADALQADGITLHPYAALGDYLRTRSTDTTLGADMSTLSYYHYLLLPADQWQHLSSPAATLKGQKNPTEIEHLRQALRQDGVALLRLFRWLDATLDTRPVTEDQLAEQLIAFRAMADDYVQESFPAIVGYRANGAIVHYRPEVGRSASIGRTGLLLVDSGGQYRSGTTDITRTVHLGTPTREEKEHFTLVLKGYIALDRAVFPPGTTGVQLDTLARQYLWQAGLNYGHGTGHGVGFFLNVHEGPQGISPNPRAARSQVAFVPGMVTSNEPGYYRDGEYGIRIENLILCTPVSAQADSFLCFETLSLYPIQRNLVQDEWLTDEEWTWLRTYHQRVQRELSPLLDAEEEQWLAAACAEWVA